MYDFIFFRKSYLGNSVTASKTIRYARRLKTSPMVY